MVEPELCLIRSPFLLCIFAGLLLRSAFTSEIPLGSKLSVVDNDSWASSNGDFALGFFNTSDQPSQFRIGIRFNSKSMPFSQQTVVWVAGAHVTVGSMSYFQLTPEGELVLFDSLQGVVWTSGTANQSVVSAAFRDNGNLELIDREQRVVWQSFDTPSDTLVPGQSLSVHQTLRAASKQTTSSYYSLYLNGSGQLHLRWESNITYWTSDSPSIANLSACLTTSGALQLQDQSSKPVWSVFGEDHNESVNYRFLRLDLDGNLRIYSWIDTLQSWKSVWQAVENQCKVFATCGQRGMCFLSASGSADCRCPFELADPNKCLVPYDEACESGINMLTYEKTFLYGIYPPEDSITISSLQHCKQLCLNDPQCTVATFLNDGSAQCSIKKTKYVTGFADPSLTSVSFVKRCSGPLAVNPGLVNSPPPKQPPALCVPCLIGAASATFFVFAIIQLGIGFWICRRRNITRKEVTLALTCPVSKGLFVLSFPEIRSLTGDFKNQIGPNMFKGTLQDNHLVAVKNLNASIEERRFRSAVTKIGSIHHKNLVKLEGYCCEFNHRFLVYEYVKNGSLDKFFGDSALCRRLTWKKRLQICSSVAKSICYLHTECREFLSHGNLKCANVLLDENLEAKVTEFGFARADGEASYCGSSAEKDVEDFGKLALTLLSGRQDTGDLCRWAHEQWIEGRSINVVDKRIDGEIDSEELERALRIIFWCLQMDERRRPSMGEVARVLDGILNVDLPPPPFAVQRPLLEDDDT
ncbi:G-type lectin S-receptor-like serine/threonine-protein kinase SD3-1 [Neltuma alba]|uniref:G-type lectin S-receptor-like serine/threonine-protein kinase SD3-1 n=1 Tax=Neltuma alba TaxID=207710 RepID=UPI0010A2C317|nr:G-type lectin S-receptor-like serine/threonine-protein kinase SD3-1 [Prosopis alba]XP_028774444.1 G-type lectin S-receptor-like serine/threonine-protein kinase SD3-1 [Prosopis alba]XP_028774445.1 G-type lectin S-receptor-like serine/threonine-protein kinase SD3-1 [Prosopis alba]XP_028774446.1 G-type lectin S-receptor-like serine/threonine-protein kinase SD3-1 [Prosopis alba]